MKTKFTKNLIFFNNPLTGDILVAPKSDKSEPICEVFIKRLDFHAEAEANAKLIAAAPDLYEALASCSETFDILLSDPDIEKNIVMVHEIRSRKLQVNKALSKAKGE